MSGYGAARVGELPGCVAPNAGSLRPPWQVPRPVQWVLSPGGGPKARSTTRCGTAEIMRRSGKSKPVVWTWQARFMAEGVEGLLRDKTRKPGKPPLPPNTVQRVGDLALGSPPGESTHWTGRGLGKAAR